MIMAGQAYCYPLTPLQLGMLFHSLSAPGSGIDIEQIVCTLREELDVTSLRKAWDRVVDLHDALRTRFTWSQDAPCQQCVLPHVDVPWQEDDWRAFCANEQARRLDRFLADDRNRGFDMAVAPMLRLTLLRFAETDYRLIWTFHHAIIDGGTFASVLTQVFDCYEAYRANKSIIIKSPRPYRDYVEWLQHLDFSRSEQYWRQLLDGFTVPTSLAVNKPIDSLRMMHDRQGDESLFIPKKSTAALKSFAQEHGLRLSTLVLGAWALLLSRYSREEDVVFGAVRACRRSTIDGADEMVGLFINTLPMRVRLTRGIRLVVWLKQLLLQWQAMREYEHTPLASVQGWSAVPRGKPLFDSIVMFDNQLLDTQLRNQGGSWLKRSFRVYVQPNYPITLMAYSGDELNVQIGFDRARFDPRTITRMINHYRTLLEGMLGGSEKLLDELPMLTPEEHHQLLVEWNTTRVDYPKDILLHELFEAQVERSPDAVAVEFDGEEVSYRELNERANRLAHRLRRLGVAPGAFVGVCMERSLDLVVALYGVVKAGGAYVPIDPEYPKERVDFMLEDAGVPVLLTQSRLAESLRDRGSKVLFVDDENMAGEDCANPAVSMKADDLAYMIYTSGSTGKPKGAMNTHRGICNRLLWMQDRYRLTASDGVLQKTPFSFDVSVWEFFWPLLAGARMVLAAPGGHRDAAYLVRLIREQDITITHFVPSMLRVFLEEPGVEGCRSLRHVICSGEALPFELQQRFFQKLPAELHNLYGPTEAAVDVTAWTCQRNSARKIVPIGRPIANTRIYILDKHLQPVPVGVPGELCIGGVQVGRGYHNRPDLTAEKFIPDPFADDPGARLYRTGDLCRWLEDGNIEYLGRMDFQVKIRGFRIELGEIESVLAEHPMVRQCLVAAREDASGEQTLAAYVVWEPGTIPSAGEMREWLARKLPDHMVPSAFVGLDQFPLSPNGKVDRRALPAPSPDPLRDTRAAGGTPVDEVERTVERIWCDVLGISGVDRESSFFDVGGNSLSLMRVRAKLQQAFRKDITILDLLQSSNIRSLAGLIRGTSEVSDSPGLRDANIEERKAAAARRRQTRQRIAGGTVDARGRL